MKALTIWQPWASLIMAGAKPWEWRGWAPPRSLVGQRIAIHAGARKVGRLDHHKFAWPLTDIERFEPPVPARGAQGLWDWHA